MKKLYLFAKEDIYDGYLHNIIFLKDELVGNIELIKEIGDDLPRGNYYIQESLNDDMVNIRIEEKLEDSRYYENLFMVKSCISISIRIRDCYSKELIEGMHIGLFALEDIYDKNDCILYYKDDLIANYISSNNTSFQVPLFNVNNGSFYISQIESVDGYYLSLKQIPINVDFINNQTEFLITYDNVPTRVEINKLNSNYQYLPGVWLAIYDENNNLIDEWMSKQEHVVYRLKIGNRYVIKEMKNPVGYQKCKDTTFVVQDKNGDIQSINLFNTRINNV